MGLFSFNRLERVGYGSAALTAIAGAAIPGVQASAQAITWLFQAGGIGSLYRGGKHIVQKARSELSNVFSTSKPTTTTVST